MKSGWGTSTWSCSGGAAEELAAANKFDQAGRTLLQHARVILAQSERLNEDLTPYARGLAGQVRVLSNTNALTEFLPETLSSFLTAYPDISVDLEERLSDEIVGLIAEGNGDIGIVGVHGTGTAKQRRFGLGLVHFHIFLQ